MFLKMYVDILIGSILRKAKYLIQGNNKYNIMVRIDVSKTLVSKICETFCRDRV